MKKKVSQPGFFDGEFRMERLTELKDPLVCINQLINWEAFLPTIETAFPATEPSLGGRPSFDKLMMFKALILQQIYGLSDGQTEFQITDRISFMRFLGLHISDKVPDQNTIWYYRERLTETGVIDRLFDLFVERLRKAGLIVNKGRMVDASIAKAPIQRNTREENKYIRETGEKPAEWSEGKARQKDADADWTKKHDRNYYGYKNHIKADKDSKLIVNFETTPASVHDSQVLPELLEETDRGQPLWADGAYIGEDIETAIAKYQVKNKIHKKGYRNNPLTKKEKGANRKKSKCRARVEHVFASLKQFKSEMSVRCIGLERATGVITLQNLTYNMFRAKYLLQLQGIGVPV